MKYVDLVGIEQEGGNANTQGATIDALASLSGVCSIDMARGLVVALHRPTWTRRQDGARAHQWQEYFYR